MLERIASEVLVLRPAAEDRQAIAALGADMTAAGDVVLDRFRKFARPRAGVPRPRAAGP